MKALITSEGDFTEGIKVLNNLANIDISSEVRGPMNQTKQELAAGTPTETGKTADQWRAEIERKSNGFDIQYYNSSMTKTGIPIVKLLYYGHGTGTGGYVPPRDFITAPMENLHKTVSRNIERKIISGK